MDGNRERNNPAVKGPQSNMLLNITGKDGYYLEVPRKRPLESFLQIARVVRMLCAVCKAVRRYAMDAGYLDSYTVNVSRRFHLNEDDNKNLEEVVQFSLKDFQLRKELPVPTALIRTLDKHPVDRTGSDLQAITSLMRNMPSFRKYTREMQHMFCQIVRYMKCHKRRVVLRKGHIGYNLYFIYTGSVSVVFDQDDGNVFVKPEKVILRRGACFGEIALMQNTRRNATVVCHEDCEFLVIDKEDFLSHGLAEQLQQEFLSRYKIFRSWPAFSTWSDDNIRTLSYVSRTETVGHGKVIVKDSRTNEWLWFIIKGSCDVLRLTHLEKNDSFRRANFSANTSHRFMVNSGADKNYKRSPPASARPKTAKSESTSDKSSESGKSSKKTGIRPKTTIGVHRQHSLSRPKSSNSLGKLVSSGEGRIQNDRGPSIKGQYSHLKILSSRHKETDELPLQFRNSSQNTRAASPAVCSLPSVVKSSTIIEDEEEDDMKEQQSVIDEKQLTLRKDSSGVGVFVKLDTLRDGQCFGLESIFDTPLMTSLVSQGCEVIHVPRNKVVEMADDDTLKALKNLISRYPSDNELCKRFLETNKWDHYKNTVMNDCLSRFDKTYDKNNLLAQKEYGASENEYKMTISNVMTALKSYYNSEEYNGPHQDTPEVTQSKLLPKNHMLPHENLTLLKPTLMTSSASLTGNRLSATDIMNGATPPVRSHVIRSVTVTPHMSLSRSITPHLTSENCSTTRRMTLPMRLVTSPTKLMMSQANLMSSYNSIVTSQTRPLMSHSRPVTHIIKATLLSKQGRQLTSTRLLSSNITAKSATENATPHRFSRISLLGISGIPHKAITSAAK